MYTRSTSPTSTFDVVHAHQVLQHVADPVAALREMRRVCRPGGVVAVRDGDYAAMTWYPPEPALAEWLALYRDVARHNGGEPDAGRRLLAWARAAGFTDITVLVVHLELRRPRTNGSGGPASGSTGSWRRSGRQAVADGFATADELAAMVAGWRRWAADGDGWFAILHGEILARR